MVYKHADVAAAFRIYTQHGEDAAKRGDWRYGNYIVDHEKLMELRLRISVGTLSYTL